MKAAVRARLWQDREMLIRWFRSRHEADERAQCDASLLMRNGAGTAAREEALLRARACDRTADLPGCRHWHRVAAVIAGRKRYMIDENARERYAARRERRASAPDDR